ncbi:glycosyltransferase family 2 protein [Leptolyngbya sp. FACHB-261]|uniref:glycosyltransferase family 2 protein n=1 Tax=Leptolyngbya sp. FACHB-261 TaxID=2692806 RepID=UPI0016897B7E|nr:glycosyltransferase family 2 protein [Leptolyngbya sp. FACHB-261]MBD2103239.1 glycosyltransferase family 2 protein [Leptolyngbya sp. FACHB-261]
MPKVAVIIPVHCVEKYIAATVQSVLKQTFSDFELLIVDDQCPQRSVEICQQFSDPRIKVIHQRNRGLAGARNTGIRQAQGEYLAFLDGDDLWLPEKLAKHVEHLERSPEVGVSFSRSALINEAGEALGTYLMPQLQNITAASLFRVNPIGNGSAAVLRRQTLEAIRFQANLYGTPEDFYFDEQFRRAEDIECWLRIASLTDWQIEGLPEALTLYRVNSGGLSANLEQQLAAWQQVVEKVQSYAPDLAEQWGKLGTAYRLRYLARSAVRLQAGPMAVQFLHRSLRLDPRILWQEPRRTLRILAAAYLLWLLPQSLYNQLENSAAKIASTLQKRRILQEQSGQSA